MKHALTLSILLACVAGFFQGTVQAEQHRATRLGNPATRFAPPVATRDELRSRFRDESLRRDMAEVLRQWGWTGRTEDLFRAALTEEIREVSIPVGTTTVPFMSSREDGKPVCLRNVLWAGKEAAPAYAFNFTSIGRRYRCVIPKACSNFYLEDLGLEPLPALAIQCAAPAEVPVGRPLQVCLTVLNSGTAPLVRGTVRLPVPSGITVTSVTERGVASQREVVWEMANLPAKASRTLCAVFEAPALGSFTFQAAVSAPNVRAAQTSCSTKVIGVSAIHINVIDLEDPIQVGNEVTYEVKVTNQGSSEGTNVGLAINLPLNEEFVSGGGATAVRELEGAIKTDPLPRLAPKDAAVWHVRVRAKAAGDVRFTVELTSDQFPKPIRQEESTLLY